MRLGLKINLNLKIRGMVLFLLSLKKIFIQINQNNGF